MLHRHRLQTRLSWLGWTYTDLALVIGVSPSTLSRELRYAKMKPGLLEDIVWALDISLEVLEGAGDECDLVGPHRFDETRARPSGSVCMTAVAEALRARGAREGAEDGAR